MATAQVQSPKPAAPANNASAKPQAPKADKPKAPKRIDHPLLSSKDPAVYPFTTAPADFNGKQHLPFKKKDFKEEHQYYEWRLGIARANLAKLEAAYNESKVTGGSKDKAGAKRLAKMASRMADLQQKLSAKNVDVGAVLKASGVDIAQLQAMLAQAQGAKA